MFWLDEANVFKGVTPDSYHYTHILQLIEAYNKSFLYEFGQKKN
jgi:hypothetical protein